MGSFVYFVQAGPGGPVKIGRAKDVDKRMAGLQTACPYRLQLLGVIECDHVSSYEAELHERFAELRIDRSEWFNWAPAIADTVAKETRPYESRTKIEVAVAAASLGLDVITIPARLLGSWKATAERECRASWTMLYDWLSKGRDADYHGRAHNRTRVGESVMQQLLDIERVRLRKAWRIRHGHSPSAKELRKALMWSNLNSGPMTTDPRTGRHLIGDGLFVIGEDVSEPPFSEP